LLPLLLVGAANAHSFKRCRQPVRVRVSSKTCTCSSRGSSALA
jgi:hypothetical protein